MDQRTYLARHIRIGFAMEFLMFQIRVRLCFDLTNLSLIFVFCFEKADENSRKACNLGPREWRGALGFREKKGNFRFDRSRLVSLEVEFDFWIGPGVD